MNKYLGYLKSRTVWTLILLFVINGVEPIRESIPANALPVIDAILGMMGIYFRVKPKQDYTSQMILECERCDDTIVGLPLFYGDLRVDYGCLLNMLDRQYKRSLELQEKLFKEKYARSRNT